MLHIAGLRKAYGGEPALRGVVEVAGVDALRRSREVRRLLGLARQETGIYPVVSVRNNLTLFGELRGLTRRDARRRADEARAAAVTG